MVFFENAKDAFLFLEKKHPNIYSISFANEEESIDVSLSCQKTYLCLDFWDFDTEVYDAGGPTEAMRRNIFSFHSALGVAFEAIRAFFVATKLISHRTFSVFRSTSIVKKLVGRFSKIDKSMSRCESRPTLRRSIQMKSSDEAQLVR